MYIYIRNLLFKMVVELPVKNYQPFTSFLCREAGWDEKLGEFEGRC